MKTHYPNMGHCRYRISAKAIIKNKTGRFALALKEMNVHGEVISKWDIPGGGIEHGENVHNTLRREIMEEMGLKVTSISPSPLHFTLAESACGETPLGLLYHEVEVEHFNYTPSKECKKLQFFTVEEALQEDLWSAVRKTLEERKDIFEKFYKK